MKNFPSAVDTQLAAQKKQPVNLFILHLSSTVRFAASKTNVVFPSSGGNTYTAKAITVSGLDQSAQGTIERVTFKFDNTDRSMASYAHAEEFQNKVIEWWRVFRDALANSQNYIEMFRGLMEQPSGTDRNWMKITAIAQKGIRRSTQKLIYGRNCGHTFGDAQCNYNGYADLTSLKASGTADSGSITTLTDNALTQAADYWNYGAIEITIDGYTYRRIVRDFNASTDTITFDVELPVAVGSGDSYTVWKGCPKTWAACGAGSAYGPSSNNQNNFGGHIHISTDPEAEAVAVE